MSIEKSVFDLIGDIGKETSKERILDRLRAVAESCGFSSFCLAGIPDPGLKMDPYILLSGWNEEWFDRYIANDYVQDDPVIAKLRTTDRPFVWRSVYKDGTRITERGQQVMDEATVFRMKDGFCVPIFSMRGFQAAMTFGGEAVDLSDRSAAALQIVSIFAHGRIRDLLGASAENDKAKNNLSNREKECLKWTSAGKTSWEISKILNISQHTVDWYLASVARKLGATNRTQAVAEGFRRGFLH